MIPREERPWVVCNMAMSADGKITTAARQRAQFTSPADRLRMDRLRAQADAVIIGAATLRHDNPRLGVRHPPLQAWRQSLGKSPDPMRVVVTNSGQLPLAAHFFTEPLQAAARIVATHDSLDAATSHTLSQVAEVWRLGSGNVDLARLLQELHSRGVHQLLLEGGGELNASFCAAAALDELHLTLAPTLLGGRDAPTLLEGDGYLMAQRLHLELLEVERVGSELFCRYAVNRNAP